MSRERSGKRAWLGLVCLVLLAAALMGARAVSKNIVNDTYINDVQMTSAAGAIMRFHATQTGAASTGATSTRVYFMDVVNKATGEATLRIYTPAGFYAAAAGTANVVIYIPAGAGRSIDGIPIDSVAVDAATGIDATHPVIFTGMKKR